MNILSIGNSFSQYAHRYLHAIAKSDGYTLNTFNLFIGGCSLSTHFRNMMSDNRAYTLEMNGESTGFKVSLNEALLSLDWDVITIQQVSHCSPYYETYQPYLSRIIDNVKVCVPKAKIAFHQTWAYEQDSERLNKELGYEKHEDMFNDIKSSCMRAADEINADYIIPSGELIEKLVFSGIKVHRDTFHASLGVGRYALGLLWYSILTGNDITSNTFSDFDKEVFKEESKIAKQCVIEICNG